METTRPGSKYIGKLPDWFDERGRLTTWNNQFIIAHPDHVPHFFDVKRGEWIKIISLHNCHSPDGGGKEGE